MGRIKELENELKAKNSELQSTRESLSAVESEAESLTAENQKYQREAKIVQQSRNRSEPSESDSEPKNIKQEADKFEMEAILKKMELECGHKDKEIVRLSKAMLETERNFEALKKLSESTIADPSKDPLGGGRKDSRSSFEKERDILSELIADQRLDIERWSAKSNKLERELKEKESEMQALEERLRQSRLDSSKLQDTLNTHRRQHYSSVPNTSKDIEREQKYIVEMKLELDRRVRDLDEREEKLSRNESDLAIKNSEHTSRDNNFTSTKAREIDLLAKIDKLLCQVTVLEETVGDLTAERNQLRSKLEISCEDLAMLKVDNETLSKQLSTSAFSQQQLHEYQSKHLTIETKCSALEDELVILKSENETVRQKLSEAERELAKKGRHNSELVHESSKKQVEFNVLYYELEGLRAENRALKRSLEESKNETESARRKICTILDRRCENKSDFKVPTRDVSPKRKSVTFRTAPKAHQQTDEPNTKSRYAQLYADMLAIQTELQEKEKNYQLKYKK